MPAHDEIELSADTPGGRLDQNLPRLSHHMMGLIIYSTALSSWFYHPFSLAKIPSNYHKKSQISTSPKAFLVVDL